MGPINRYHYKVHFSILWKIISSFLTLINIFFAIMCLIWRVKDVCLTLCANIVNMHEKNIF